MERMEEAEFRADLRSGIVASTIANFALGFADKKSRVKATTPLDFMPMQNRLKPDADAEREAELIEWLERVSVGGQSN